MSVVVLEGLPGSGKTTLANFLRDFYGFSKINESSGMAHETKSQSIVFIQNIWRHFKAQLSAGDVILDRGYHSMLAWDYCSDFSEYRKKYFLIKFLFRLGILRRSDLHVYIKCSEEFSRQRKPFDACRTNAWSTKEGLSKCKRYYDNFLLIERRVIIISAKISTAEMAKIICKNL